VGPWFPIASGTLRCLGHGHDSIFIIHRWWWSRESNSQTAHEVRCLTIIQLKAPLISTIIIAVLTLLPVLPLTIPLHISQCRLYDPRIALVLDLVASLFWLASFAALVSYLDVFHEYGKALTVVGETFQICSKCRGAWKSGAAAAAFAIIELYV
jgi:hypothetical protein